MTHHRSPRQNPQIDSREEAAVMPRRRSPGLHPQIPASEDGVGTTRHVRRRRGKSPAAPESPPFNEDMLREILLRLPPQPSSLLRASAVCKHWRGLVTDPRFLRRFRAHQRKPPLLGVFVTRAPGIKFRSILGPPDRIPPERFDLRRKTCCRTWTVLLGCRHGRVLHLDYKRHKVIVCDPVTGEHHHVDVPPVFRGSRIDGAVLCAATDQGHLHGSCHCGLDMSDRKRRIQTHRLCILIGDWRMGQYSSQRRIDVGFMIVILDSLLVTSFTGRQGV
uniref:Uncharacterized protein n=1 Tax=Avena sativa TaxID=4498 RepID=A0ACD5ZYN7_AVESA